MSVRRTIALNIITTSMSSSDIDGITATKTKADSLNQASNSFIVNVENVGHDAWLSKLIAARNKFEQKLPTGARSKLYRLSRKAGLPCLSWGESGQSCVDYSICAPREAFFRNQPYWKARISSEMHKGLKLYNLLSNSLSIRSKMALHLQRLCLVVLLDEIGHIYHQL